MLAMPDMAAIFDGGAFDWIFEAAGKRELPVGLMLPPSSVRGSWVAGTPAHSQNVGKRS